MNIVPNHYRTLAVHRKATPDEIKAARNAVAKGLHPDLNANDPAKANQMAEVNVAYGVLSDTKQRKEYDTKLSLLCARCSACEGEGVKSKQKGFTKKILVPCKYCDGTGVA